MILPLDFFGNSENFQFCSSFLRIQEQFKKILNLDFPKSSYKKKVSDITTWASPYLTHRNFYDSENSQNEFKTEFICECLQYGCSLDAVKEKREENEIALVMFF